MKWIVLACLAITAFAGGGLAAPWLAEPTDDGYPAAAVQRHAGGAVDVDGLIVSGTVARVRQAIATGPVPVLRIRSFGGLGPAAHDLATLLNEHGIPLEVQREKLCSSACVMLVAEMRPALRRVDAGALLRVHGSATGSSDPLEAIGPEDGMGPWVRRLSPSWYAYLAGCASRPLVRDAGIAMFWGEVTAVERGAGPDCARIAYRNKDWVTWRELAKG